MKNILSVIALLSLAAPLSGREQTVRFSELEQPAVTAHVNGRGAPVPKGAGAVVTSKGLVMNFHFPSAGHDALMAEFPVNLECFDTIIVKFNAGRAGHRPFIVFTDANGEKHYFSLIDSVYISRQAVCRTGAHTVKRGILLKNKHAGEYFAYRWGGDDNQKIDFPVKKLMIGINDHPDSAVDSGTITFESVTFRQSGIVRR